MVELLEFVEICKGFGNKYLVTHPEFWHPTDYFLNILTILVKMHRYTWKQFCDVQEWCWEPAEKKVNKKCPRISRVENQPYFPLKKIFLNRKQ